jgi:hypothetical protein
MIKSGIGKDATAMFNGGVYNHSNAAHNLLSTMRVGVIRGGMEVEIWKRAAQENKDTMIIKDGEGNKVIRAGAQVTKVAEPPASAGAAEVNPTAGTVHALVVFATGELLCLLLGAFSDGLEECIRAFGRHR